MQGTSNRLSRDRAAAADNASALWWRQLEPLAEATRAGDSSAQSQALALLRPMIAGAIASSLKRPLPAGVEHTDVEQEAVLQACDLIRSYDPKHGASLPVYVGRTLKWRLMNYLRAEARRVGHERLEAEHLETIVDETADMPEPCLEAPRVRSAMRQLSPRQRAVIAGIYWRQRTTAQVAGDLGVTRQAVMSARRRAEEILRHEMGPRERT